MKPEQHPENLDQILASDEELVPSSGFAASVLERVREETATPQPITFPWRRVLPGAVVVAIGLVWCLMQLARMGIAVANTPILTRLHPATLFTPRSAGAAWAIAAIGASMLCCLLARRLAGTRGLI